MPANEKIEEIYIDGFQKLNFSGGVIRANLVRLETEDVDTTKKNPNPKIETVQRVVMSLNGFLMTVNAMNDLVNKMKEAGIIQERETETGKSGGKKK